MTTIRKSFLYASFFALGLTTACANYGSDVSPSETPATETVSTDSVVSDQTPIDITLDDGQSIMAEVKTDKTTGTAGFNFLAEGDEANAVEAVPQDITQKAEEVEENIIITNSAASVESANKASEEAAVIQKAVKEDIAKPYYHRETIVSRKVSQLEKDLDKVVDFVDKYDRQIDDVQKTSETQATEYYSYVAAIQSRLQGGSTPGNPILVEQMQNAQKELDALASSVSELNKLSNEISSNASVASFLLESVRATYNLSGAVEDDHKKLTGIEDDLNATIVRIDRQLNDLSDDVNRRASYLATERRNLQTLSLAVANGEPYGQSLARKAYGPISTLTGITAPGNAFPSSPVSARPVSNRPMMVIRFDRPNVDYQQAVYMAASETLEKYPDAVFEIVAVTPARGNAAQRALASSDARQNAESVFRTMVEMGVPSSRVKLAAAQSPSAATTEVHIFLR